jgi:hypothetical protein
MEKVVDLMDLHVGSKNYRGPFLDVLQLSFAPENGISPGFWRLSIKVHQVHHVCCKSLFDNYLTVVDLGENQVHQRSIRGPPKVHHMVALEQPEPSCRNWILEINDEHNP